MWLFSFPSTICWRSDIFFILYFWYVCQKLDDLHGFISRSDIYPLISMFGFVPVLCCFCYYSSVIFEIKYCNTISIAYFAQNCLGYLDFFFFLIVCVCVCVTHSEIRRQFWQWILIFFLVETCRDKVSSFSCCCLFQAGLATAVPGSSCSCLPSCWNYMGHHILFPEPSSCLLSYFLWWYHFLFASSSQYWF